MLREDAINGDPDDPDITANTRPQAVIQAMGRANKADHFLHSQTLREMRDSKHQYNKLHDSKQVVVVVVVVVLLGVVVRGSCSRSSSCSIYK